MDTKEERAARDREKKNQAAKRTYAARRAQGKCINCGGSPENFFDGVRFRRRARCRVCLQRDRERDARRKANTTPPPRLLSDTLDSSRSPCYETRRKAAWKTNGKCVACGKGRDVETQAASLLTCYRCRKMKRDASARKRALHGNWLQQARNGKALPVGGASSYRRKGPLWAANITFDDTSWAAWLRIKERHRLDQAARWGERGTPGYREHVETCCQNSHLMRQTILAWKDRPCSRRQFFIGLNGYKVGVALDTECREIVEKFAARYTNGNKTEAIRCMIEGCGVGRAVLGSRRRETF